MEWSPNETSKRIVFESSYDFEQGAIFAMNKAGGLTVNVSEEQAVDSYNDSFTCTMTMTREQATDLMKWLTKQLT